VDFAARQTSHAAISHCECGSKRLKLELQENILQRDIFGAASVYLGWQSLFIKSD
jgi:hypothetical protein